MAASIEHIRSAEHYGNGQISTIRTPGGLLDWEEYRKHWKPTEIDIKAIENRVWELGELVARGHFSELGTHEARWNFALGSRMEQAFLRGKSPQENRY